MKVILASQSPRRKEILQEMGIDFEVIVPKTQEIFDLSLPLEEALTQVAHQKALAVQKECPDALILAADTIVTYQGQIYGKPSDLDQARTFLRTFSDTCHEVWTASCYLNGDKMWSSVDKTKILFRPLSDQDIEAYLSDHNPLDKAGAYGIQESDFVKEIQGSYSNVVGFCKESAIQIFEKIKKEQDDSM